MLLEDPHAAVAGDVVLEALELDAAVARDVDDPERREVREAAVGADRAELPGLGHDLLLGAGVLERLQHGHVDRLGARERDRPAFCDAPSAVPVKCRLE